MATQRAHYLSLRPAADMTVGGLVTNLNALAAVCERQGLAAHAARIT